MNSSIPKIDPTHRHKSVADVLESKISNAKCNQRKYDYTREALHPLACLAFVVPLLALYEASITFQPEIARSAIDRILLPFLEPMGGTCVVVLPFVLIGALAFLTFRRGAHAGFHPQTLVWLWLESILLSVILFFACDALMLYADNQRPEPLAGLATLFTDRQQYSRLITSLGSGIHEELIFRLLLFAPLLWGLKQTIGSERIALIFATVAVSLLFAVAHCDFVNTEGFPFKLSTFTFRFLASSLLCILFRYRGFAVVVGVHVIFDILAVS